MTILITGVAGFIGMHTAKALLEQGDMVIGVDNLNDYYDVSLKHARLNQLTLHSNFTFIKADITDQQALNIIKQDYSNITHIIHLAAQAGVRYSLENPRAYIQSNIVGHLEILELARNLENLEHLIYASSSSVYGGNTKLPFSTTDQVDTPVSLYAATKKADELMTHTYTHLYNIKATGLRFFTVYGPWGRPDMAPYIFTRKILDSEPIELFNDGKMSRDFTYIDDIVDGILSAASTPPEQGHAIYNLGNNTPTKLLDFVENLEEAIGRQAEKIFKPMQPGDVESTWADITESEKNLNYSPKTNLKDGLTKFVEWYKQADY